MAYRPVTMSPIILVLSVFHGREVPADWTYAVTTVLSVAIVHGREVPHWTYAVTTRYCL